MRSGSVSIKQLCSSITATKKPTHEHTQGVFKLERSIDDGGADDNDDDGAET